ncbi:MAG: hypothetical protein ACE5HO_01190 [bacterium]
MHRMLLTISMSLILTPGIGLSQSHKAHGTLFGFIYNGSKATDAAPKVGLANQEVVIYKYLDGQTEEGTRAHTTTDSRGRFAFKNLEVGKRFAYYPATVVGGIEYYGDVVTLTPDTLNRRSDITTFEPSASDSSISVVTQHIIVTPGAGVLQVKEIAVFSNRGRHTYVGSVPAGQPGKNIVLRMDLPDNAKDVQFGGDLMACCAMVSGNHIFDTMEFKPGVRQEVVSYLLPYKGQSTSVVKKVAYPTAAIDVFLPENLGALQAQGFVSQGSFQIRGENYTRYTAAGFARGRVLTLTFGGLPAAPADWRWLPPVVLGLLLVVGFTTYHLRRRAQSTAQQITDETAASEVDPERQRLLAEILQLDEAYEAGEIDENTYAVAREKRIAMVNARDEPQNVEPVEQQPGGAHAKSK